MGLWIEGDQSGAVLVVQLAGDMGRDYAIPIDFTGRRWIEIPHGQASYALGKWGWRFAASKYAHYDRVTAVRLGYGYLPPERSASVTIGGLQALREIPVELRDPVIDTQTGTLRIHGAIPPDHYLEYQGSDRATLYDANWNRVGELPVSPGDASVPAGESPLVIRTEQTGPLPWLEVQFLSRGDPIVVRKR
jgi:hypothetical protein